jgi:hypothetical protein
LMKGKKKYGHVTETCEAVSKGGWSGFRRNFSVDAEGWVTVLFQAKVPDPNDPEMVALDAGSGEITYFDHGQTVVSPKAGTEGTGEALGKYKYSFSIDVVSGLEPTPEELATYTEAL